MTDLATLTVAEVDCLADCEQRIERGLKTFVEVGTSLATIRDNRLYRTEHATFEDYVEARWQLSRAHAYRMISAAAVVSPIGDTELPMPSTESQARELARVPEPERADVWRETVERTEGKPTAAAIRAVHGERTQTPAPFPGPETEAAGTSTPAASVHDHPDDLPGEADARPAARTIDPIDDPEFIAQQQREGSSDVVAEALVAVKMRLEPDPIRWFTETWIPGRYRFRDMPLVRDCFTPDGLRASAKHLELLADHLERTGGSL